MVLTGTKENVSGNLGQSKSFKMEMNGAAIQILTDKLYKYPIRAIVRELAANAIDAHRVSKIPLDTWEITLPSSLNPTFAIEDHGVGMNDSEIDEVYTTFFKSTKSSSNDQTGMFGLGSKTPFAYSKQFIVESSKDGFKNIYSMHAEDGELKVTKVNPEPIPTDKTGTKVSFAVKSQDFDEFYDAMIYSSAVWPGIPKINGASEFYSYLKDRFYRAEESAEQILKNTNEVYSKMEIVPSSDEKVFKKLGNENFSLEMGNVLYYVSTNELDMDYIFKSPKSQYIIHANIGDVSITPNREDLQYDEKTKEFLKKAIKSLIVKNHKFSFKDIDSSEFATLMKLSESEITPEALVSLKSLIKEYKDITSKIEKIGSKVEKKNIFAIRSYPLRNSSKNLTSAWRPLSVIIDSSENPGKSLLENFVASSEKLKIIELKESEFNRYKITDGALTGFFNSRVNRMNRDLFADFNKIDKENESEIKSYSNEIYVTPLYVFCKENTADDVKKLYPAFSKAEVIKDFSKLPNSFDYGKVVETKEKIDTNERICLDIYDGTTRTTHSSFNGLRQNYSDNKIILATKPGSCYDFIDFKKYISSKDALDKYPVTSIRSYEIDDLMRQVNDELSEKVIVVAGRPSDFKKMKLFDAPELSFLNEVKPIKEIMTEMADKLAEKNIIELEKLPVNVKSQRAFTEDFIRAAKGFLPTSSEFLNYMEDTLNQTTSPAALKARSNCLNKAMRNRKYQSESMKLRADIYDSDKSNVDLTKDILEKIKSYPLGKTFVNKYFSCYYSDAYWMSDTPFGDFFEIVKLTEK